MGRLQHIVLRPGALSVPYEDVPRLIAEQVHPPMKGETTSADMLRAEAEDFHRKELRRAVDAGEVPLVDHAAGLPTTAADHAHIRVPDLKEYLARFDIGLSVAFAGAGVRVATEPRAEPWPAADWETWAFMPKATLREAVLLSIGLEPRLARTVQPGYAPVEYQEPGQEFIRRLTVASAYLSEDGPLRPLVPAHMLGSPSDALVALPSFRSWAESLGWPLPERFPSVRAPKQPESPTAQSARPAAAVSSSSAERQAALTTVEVCVAIDATEASEAQALSNWKMRAQAEAARQWRQLRAAGANPTIASIAPEIARWCRENDVRTDGNINPSSEYLRVHVLGGRHWTPPR